MDYIEAAALVQQEGFQPEGHLMMIELGWTRLLLPYSQGITFLACLENVQRVEDMHSVPKLTSLSRSDLTVTPLSVQGYQNLRIASLLNIKISEVEQAAKDAEEARKNKLAEGLTPLP